MGACITTKALTYPESLTSSLLGGAEEDQREREEEERRRERGGRGQLTSAAPCVTAEKQQGSFQ